MYLLIAWLAVRIAVGTGGKADKTAALAMLATNPAGRALLWVITVGLVGLVVWQVAEAIWGYRHARSTKRRTLRRLISLAEVVLFGVLAYSAGSIAAGGSGNSDAGQASVTAALLALSGGPWLVGAIGAGVLVGGFYLSIEGSARHSSASCTCLGPTTGLAGSRSGSARSGGRRLDRPTAPLESWW